LKSELLFRKPWVDGLVDLLFVEDLVDFVWLFFLVDLWVLLCGVDLVGDVAGAVGVVGATAGAFAAGGGAPPEGAWAKAPFGTAVAAANARSATALINVFIQGLLGRE
jgi:hypothetical protein